MAENKHDPHSPHDVSEPELPVGKFEERDVNVWAVGKFAIGLALLCVVCLALVLGAFKYFESMTGGTKARVSQGIGVDAGKLPPEPRLEVTPITDLQDMRAAEDKVLSSYGWIDQSHGVVRIPIDRAMDLLAQRGLPARQQNDPQSAAAGVSVPTESGLGEKVQQSGGPLAAEPAAPVPAQEKAK
jgi:hypothetical protein